MPQVSVTTSATALTTSPGDCLVRNAGAASVFLGASAVTTSNGYELPAGEAVGVTIGGDLPALYGICAAGTVRVDVLQGAD